QVVNYGCAIHLFTNYVGTFSIMTGPSMFPTFAEWDIVVEDCLSVRLNLENLARGDLVTLKSPIEPTKRICKRVIGLPGDTVCVDPTGQVLPSTEHVLVPKGHIWIAGDNATISRDSRHYGPVSMSLLHSKVVARVGLKFHGLTTETEVFPGLAFELDEDFSKSHDVYRVE
ncbi:peptidase S24/S26A/S26B/S26C, partial [Mycena floridula]